MKKLLTIFILIISTIFISGCTIEEKTNSETSTSSLSNQQSDTNMPDSISNADSGCVDKSLPPSPKDMGLAVEKYSYDTAPGYDQSLLRMLQIPSRCLGVGADGKPVRIADLKAIDSEEKVLIYNIQYPPYDLDSVGKFRLGWTRSILEETFPEKWLIRYEYTKEHPEKYGIPDSYSIFAYSHETKTYDKLLDKFTLLQIEWGHLRFRNSAGKVIERDTWYFVVVPDETF